MEVQIARELGLAPDMRTSVTSDARGAFGAALTWMTWQFDFQRPVVEEYPKLDVRELQRAGLLQGSHQVEWSDGSSSRLDSSEDGIDVLHWPAHTDFLMRTYADLIWTPCNFGGRRAWFRCLDCSRRVAILHAFPGFSCRACHRLSYASSNRAKNFQPEPVLPVQMI